MNKADKYYVENLRKILDEGCLDEDPRPKYVDGTPAHSKFITQVFEEYDISKGEHPIVNSVPTILDLILSKSYLLVLYLLHFPIYP